METERLISNAEKEIEEAVKTLDTEALAKVEHQLANILYDNNRLDEAILWAKKSLIHAREANLSEQIARTYLNLGAYSNKLKELTESIFYFERAISIFDSLGLQEMTSLPLMNTGVSYQMLGCYEDALTSFEKAYIIELAGNRPQNCAVIIGNIGATYQEMGKYTKAREAFQKGIVFAEAVGDTMRISKMNFGIANTYIKENEYAKAKSLIAQNITVYKPSLTLLAQADNYTLFSEIHTALGSYEEALAFLKTATALRDSIQTQKDQLKLEKQTQQFQLAETTILNQQKVIAEQQSAALRTQMILLVVVFIVIALFIMLWIHKKNNRQKEEVKQLEKRIYQLQMNPHFFFNILTSIQAYLFEAHPDRAVHYLGILGGLFRETLEFSRRDRISLEEEVGFLKNYLELQQLVHEHKFEYSIHLQPGLADYKLPSMLIQPFVENALKHGKISQMIDGKVEVSIVKKENGVLLEIADNGVGFDQLELGNTASQKSSKTSLALKITQERMVLLFGKKSNLTINNRRGGGTQVLIQLPY
ncbi:MAG: tetratricopeptide repeat-containing sensor histidine kinase [Lewinella sp.]|uniref:tetratricopeptide repeat-containing sensor histidine kinase n=1 Tax=Lewinella sp. TaxID=2004506 RepID=UPI003D6C43E4